MKSALLLLALIASAALALQLLHNQNAPEEIRARSKLAAVTETEDVLLDGDFQRLVRLTSTSDMEVTLLCRWPEGDGPFPVLILAHDSTPPHEWIPRDERSMIVVFDPPTVPSHEPVWKALRERALRAPASFLMILEYLESIPWANTDHVLLGGTGLSEFAVPIAASLAPSEPRTLRIHQESPRSVLERPSSPIRNANWFSAYRAFGGGLDPERWRAQLEASPIDVAQTGSQALIQKLRTAREQWLGPRP